MFNDRRTRKDRRQRHRPDQVPAEGCRRRVDRRDYLHYQPTPWWLRTNYVEELEPPVLGDADAPAERRTDPPVRVRPRRNR